MSTKDFDAALTDLRCAFALNSSSHRDLVDSLAGRSSKIMFSVLAGNLDTLRHDWQELIKYARKNETTWIKAISQVVMFIAESGEWVLAKELISSANLEQPLYPLVRALEYMISANEAIIEKLSPEIRAIVNDIVITLKKSSNRSLSHANHAR